MYIIHQNQNMVISVYPIAHVHSQEVAICDTEVATLQYGRQVMTQVCQTRNVAPWHLQSKCSLDASSSSSHVPLPLPLVPHKWY